MTYRVNIDREGIVVSLFQPDVLAPAQYSGTFQRKSHLEPEKKLMFAILEDAVACFQENLFARDRRRKALFQNAEDWMLEQDSDALCSFENICEILGINAGYLRDGLLSWKRRELTKNRQVKVIKPPLFRRWVAGLRQRPRLLKKQPLTQSPRLGDRLSVEQNNGDGQSRSRRRDASNLL